MTAALILRYRDTAREARVGLFPYVQIMLRGYHVAIGAARAPSGVRDGLCRAERGCCVWY